MSPPLVSVVIATWNAAGYLPQTLASALAQTWPSIEVILVDDGSSDNTPEIVAPFIPRVRYERRSHLGLAAARNEGIRLAKGAYIALLDADDLWHPTKTAVQIEIADRYPQTGLIACDAQEFCDDQVLRGSLLPMDLFEHLPASEPGQRIPREVTGDFHRAFFGGNLIACPAQALLPRQVVDRIGPFIDSPAQDFDYYLRVSRDYPITFHSDVLARWRFRPESMSGPRATRPIKWAVDVLTILEAQRGQCRKEDRALFERQVRRRVRRLGHLLMKRGRENHRLNATSDVLKLWLDHPSHPSLLAYLLALWSPNRVYQLASWARRRLMLPRQQDMKPIPLTNVR